MQEVVVTSGVRTAIGRFQGSLAACGARILDPNLKLGRSAPETGRLVELNGPHGPVGPLKLHPNLKCPNGRLNSVQADTVSRRHHRAFRTCAARAVQDRIIGLLYHLEAVRWSLIPYNQTG